MGVLKLDGGPESSKRIYPGSSESSKVYTRGHQNICRNIPFFKNAGTNYQV